MGKKIPMRQCVGCGEMKNKKEMMRVIKGEGGEISLDATGKKNGRGAYVCFNEQCLKQAAQNRGLERSFKMRIDPSIYECLLKEYREKIENG